MRPILLAPRSTNQTLPSVVIAVGSAPAESGYSTTLPVPGSRWATPSAVTPCSVNHRLPSGSSVMPFGVCSSEKPGVRPALNSVIVPLVVTLPIPGSTPSSVNHRLPSGPAVMSPGALASVRGTNSVMRGVGVIDEALAGSARSAATEASAASGRQLTLRDTG
jgi:hypothetical protein